jgi:glyoxylate reductase
LQEKFLFATNCRYFSFVFQKIICVENKMALPLVILSHPLPPEWISSLQNRVRLLTGPADPPGFAPQLLAQMGEVEGIFCLLTDKIDQALLDSAPKLRVVSNMAVGFDNVDVAACTRRDVPVGNTPGILTDATADLTMALLLSSARILPQASRDAREGKWHTWSPVGWLGADLRGATLGIVGMGKIGKAVAERSKGFGLNLIYTDDKRLPDVEEMYGAQFRPLDNLLAESDFVSLHCPLTAQTRGLMNAERLQKMKRTAILVNTSRGPVVVTDDLVRALKEGWIAGAGKHPRHSD